MTALDAGSASGNAVGMDTRTAEPAARPSGALPPPGADAAPGDRFDRRDREVRVRAAVVALVTGLAILAAKFWAWYRTGSLTVLSDAMESIVNVAAAGLALFAISFAARPADEDHPYGHGKIEFVTAGFEGGLIAFAGLTIVYEAVAALIAGHEPRRPDEGLLIVAAGGAVNLILGLYLLRVGRRHSSPALVADGHHVISDFWTSAGAVAGLALYGFTGLAWIDAVTAIVFALLLFVTGGRLLRQAARGLLDETDPALIEEIATALEAARTPGIIEVHDLRAINVGDRRHVDLHTVVPEFWTVQQAHDAMDAYEARVRAAHPPRVELQFHMDPCERQYCGRCDLSDCAVRAADFTGRAPITAASVVLGPRPPAERPL